jgi:hypothetical protein
MDAGASTDTLHVLLKYEADIGKARAELRGETPSAPQPAPVDHFRQPEPST